MSERYIVFTAWPYCNGDLHLGHIAGAYLPADVFTRYQRLRGRDVLMMSGSDTHGTPITVRAEEEGLTPREVVDRYHPRFLETFQKLGISYDLFTETDTENHWNVTQEVFLRHLERGYLYKDTMEAFYCPHCKRWLPDRYVEGTCPYCGYENARGDQCDNCGRLLNAAELINPRCRFCGNTPELRETEHFFLDLAKLNKTLLDWIMKDKEHWRASVLNFTRAQIQSGELRGRPITRDIEWGIPVPVEGFEHKRIYVWYDAVIGYFSAPREWANIIGDPEAWRPWWQDPATKSFYFIGKDNIPFHTIIWPGMLIAYGENLNLPYDVPSNEYLNVEGKQLSKSRHWVIEALDVLQRYDPDPLRYMLTVNAPETKDVNFTWDEFLRRNNEELVATWGNLANRLLSFAYKRFNGQVPEPGALDELDRELLAKAGQAFTTVGDLLEAVKLKNALMEAMALAHEANKYLNAKEPWKQIKADPQAAGTTVYVGLKVIDSLKTLLAPFLPFSSQRLHEYLGYDGTLLGRQYVEEVQEREKKHLALRYDDTDLVRGWEPSKLKPGQKLRKPASLFKKLEPEIVEEEITRLLGK